MGIVTLPVEVASPTAPEITQTVELFLDCGLPHSIVPAAILTELGIPRVGKHDFRLPDGTHKIRDKGVALFRCGEHVGGADVIFGEEGDAPQLGKSAVHAWGMILHPFRRELMPS